MTRLSVWFFFFFLRILLNLHSTPSVKDKYNVRILSNTTQQVLFFSHSKSNTNYGRHTHRATPQRMRCMETYLPGVATWWTHMRTMKDWEREKKKNKQKQADQRNKRMTTSTWDIDRDTHTQTQGGSEREREGGYIKLLSYRCKLQQVYTREYYFLWKYYTGVLQCEKVFPLFVGVEWHGLYCDKVMTVDSLV